jgi:hypothetical protein
LVTDSGIVVVGKNSVLGAEPSEKA